MTKVYDFKLNCNFATAACILNTLQDAFKGFPNHLCPAIHATPKTTLLKVVVDGPLEILPKEGFKELIKWVAHQAHGPKAELYQLFDENTAALSD